jgi:heme exporter protein C
MGLALVLALIVAPEDADQGISQRIFYIHVPIALTAYFCFGLGAIKALLLLWRGEERYDLESYVAIHQGTIFGALTLITGSIWARASWGIWWTWSSNQLVLFLVLFLFYCAYFMLRLLARGWASSRAVVGGVRAVRRRAHPGELSRDPPRLGLHPSHRLHARRAADERDDVHGVSSCRGWR